MNDDPVATQSFAGRTELNDEELMAQGGMVGYANGGMMGYANGGMIAEHPCTPSNSNWQRQSFKK
jgi:hypothetical protein